MKKDLQRKIRGQINDEYIAIYQSKSENELLELLYSEEAWQRSVAAELLLLTPETTDILLKKLQVEKALYTRLAITKKLESGDQETAEKMIAYLARIGNNQHRQPIPPSKKQSFPLPRDLIARSLGRMQPAIFSTLLAALKNLSVLQLSEILDAIGYMAFYQPALVTTETYQQLLQIRKTMIDQPLIQWKLVICFSAFPQSKELLLSEKEFAPEARRSLRSLAKK